MSLDQQSFGYVRDLVRDASGLMLEPGKEYLVEARLRPLAETAGVASVQQLIERLRSTAQNEVHWSVVEAMTTNETSFFRDLHPFESLRKTILPMLVEARRKERSLNIWSAACSTGQEPYTAAMVIREDFPAVADWNCHIRASDIAGKVLDRAKAGSYSQIEINRGMPANLLLKYFRRDKLNWVIRDDIRRMVDFFALNLTRPWPAMPAMDLIFLRNVMIYFDLAAKWQILEMARRQLKSDGFLLLGNAETTFGIHDGFERLPADRGGWHRLRNQG